MTTLDPDDGMCHETSGFLFSHKCDRFSIQKCSICQKPLCEDHGHLVPDGVMCTTCLKRKAESDRQRNPPGTETTSHSYHEHYYESSPYFYSSRYYSGYGGSHIDRSQTSPPSSTADSGGGGDFSVSESTHDPSDFTEGDAESLRQEDDSDFETDMGAS